MSQSDWTERFSERLAVQRNRVATTRSLLDGPGEKVIEHWQERRPTICNDVFSQLRRWDSELQELRRPISLDALYSERRRTERFARMFWLQPRAVYLLLQIPILWAELTCRRAFSRMLALSAELVRRIRSLRELLDEGIATDSPPDDDAVTDSPPDDT